MTGKDGTVYVEGEDSRKDKKFSFLQDETLSADDPRIRTITGWLHNYTPERIIQMIQKQRDN